MDFNLVYARTPAGDEAVRQSTRVVQRNLRMLLVQIDGKVSVGKLVAKLGNEALVLATLRDLRDEGYIAPVAEAADMWAHSPINPVSPQTVMASSLAAAETILGPMTGMGAPSVSARPRESQSISRLPGSKERRPDIKVPPLGVMLGWAMRGTLGLLVLLVLVLLFFPYDSLRPQLQGRMTQVLRLPVSIGSLNLKLTPYPRLEMGGVSVGGDGTGGAVRVELVTLPVRPYWLWSGIKLPEQLELAGVTAKTDALVDLSGRVAGQTWELRRMKVSRVQLAAGRRTLDELNGEILLGSDGSFDKATLARPDRSLRFVVARMPSGLLASFEAFGWRPGEGLPTIDAVQAKAVLGPGFIELKDIDANLLGGVLRGDSLFDWRAGDSWSGAFTVARMEARQVAATFMPRLRVEGLIEGSLSLQSQALPESLWPGSFQGNFDMDIQRGVLRGIDLGEVTRRPAGEHVRGGETRFDRMTAQVTLAPGRVDLRNVRLQAGALSGEGTLAVHNDQIEGAMQVQVRSSLSTLRQNARLGGSLLSPTVTAGR